MAQHTTTKTRTVATKTAAIRHLVRPWTAADSAHEFEGPLAAPHDRGLTIAALMVGVRPMSLPLPRNLVVGAAPGAADVSEAILDRLPGREHLSYYAGLGTLAAFGVGVWLAGRARASGREHGGDAPATKPGER